jgi:hypothetical protein
MYYDNPSIYVTNMFKLACDPLHFLKSKVCFA